MVPGQPSDITYHVLKKDANGTVTCKIRVPGCKFPVEGKRELALAIIGAAILFDGIYIIITAAEIIKAVF